MHKSFQQLSQLPGRRPVNPGYCIFIMLLWLSITVSSAQELMSQMSLVKAAEELSDDGFPASPNYLRNGDFSAPQLYNSGLMIFDQERYLRFAKADNKLLWQPLPLEAWWAKGSDAGIDWDTETCYSPGGSLRLTATSEPVTVSSAPWPDGEVIPDGAVTLSAWIRTENAQATLQLDMVVSLRNGQIHNAAQRESLALPADTSGEWRQVTLTLINKKAATAIVSLSCQRGEVWLDDVQVETGSSATAFNTRRSEWINLDCDDFPVDQLPIYANSDENILRVTVSSRSRQELRGRIRLSIAVWDKLAQSTVVADFPGSDLWQKSHKIALPLAQLKPDAYVLLADYYLDQAAATDSIKPNLDTNEPELVAKSNYRFCCSPLHPVPAKQLISAASDYFFPATLIAGSGSSGMLHSRQVLRFVISPPRRPDLLFGVTNGMIPSGNKYSWWSGYGLDDYRLARDEFAFSCDRGGFPRAERAYTLAAGGMLAHRMESQSLYANVQKIASLANPVDNSLLDIWNPAGRQAMRDLAEQVGRDNESKKLIVSYQMANETVFYGKNGLCPSEYADQSFRQFCRKIHGDLNTLNQRWGTNYDNWEQVEQPVSARHLAEVAAQQKLTGAEAIAWTAVFGQISPEVQALITLIPGRGMDWQRWRTAETLAMYREFRACAREVNPSTWYSTNLCWPNFWPQMAMPFFRSMDVTMLDMEYSAGQPRGLGNPAEMMEIMEMFESNASGKPIWGLEIYYQPQWPASSVALQNWGLLAHGMSLNFFFGWRPYSDHGPVKEPRAWENPAARPMWFIIDTDDEKLPAYTALRDNCREINDFHAKYDGFSLERAVTPLAIYVADDTSEYLSYATSNKPYANSLTAARSSLIYLLRLQGFSADYLDDQLLSERLERYQYLFLPPTPLLSEQAAEIIARFVDAGGKLILAGGSGLHDPWLNKRQGCLGGEAWRQLSWSAADYGYQQLKTGVSGEKSVPGRRGEQQNQQLDFATNLWGINTGEVAGGEAIVNADGITVGWSKVWGKGKVWAMGVYPSFYLGTPHQPTAAVAWIEQLLGELELTPPARWRNSESATPLAKHGTGSPVVEVVIRDKRRNSDRVNAQISTADVATIVNNRATAVTTTVEKFLFVLNQGGAGKGSLEFAVPSDSQAVKLTDAISDEEIAIRRIDASCQDAGAVSKLHLRPVQVDLQLTAQGYQVFRLEYRVFNR